MCWKVKKVFLNRWMVVWCCWMKLVKCCCVCRWSCYVFLMMVCFVVLVKIMKFMLMFVLFVLCRKIWWSWCKKDCFVKIFIIDLMFWCLICCCCVIVCRILCCWLNCLWCVLLMNRVFCDWNCLLIWVWFLFVMVGWVMFVSLKMWFIGCWCNWKGMSCVCRIFCCLIMMLWWW